MAEPIPDDEETTGMQQSRSRPQAPPPEAYGSHPGLISFDAFNQDDDDDAEPTSIRESPVALGSVPGSMPGIVVPGAPSSRTSMAGPPSSPGPVTSPTGFVPASVPGTKAAPPPATLRHAVMVSVIVAVVIVAVTAIALEALG